MIQIIPFNSKSFESVWILINLWKAKIPRLVFAKAILHVILKQQQRKALSFTSSQRMTVDHSNRHFCRYGGHIELMSRFPLYFRALFGTFFLKVFLE